MKEKNEPTIKLCCGGKRCPVLQKLSRKKYKITDDNGGSVILKEQEVRLLYETLFTPKNDILPD